MADESILGRARVTLPSRIMNDPRSADAQVRPSHEGALGRALSSIAGELDTLGGIISSMEEALNPVLLPPGAPSETKQTAPMSFTQMDNMAVNSADRVRALQNRLTEMTARLVL